MDGPVAHAGSVRAPLIAVIIASLILGASAAVGLFAVGDGLAQRNAEGITVTGSARAEVDADRAVWRIDAYAQAEQVATAVDEVEKALDTVIAFLRAGGIDADSITVDGLSTSVNYRWTDQGMTSEIISFSASQTVTLRSDDVVLIDRLNRDLGEVLRTGVNVTNFRPEYLISDLASLRPQLQARAVEDAVTRAKAMLSVVSGEIGTVVAIRSGPFQVSAPDSVDVSDYGTYDTSTITKSVGATVSVTFTVR